MAVKKMSRAARLKKKQEELKSRGNGGTGIIYLKEGTLRVRILPTIDDEADFVVEVIQFYLGPKLKGVFSPATFGEPCAIMDKYDELRDSDDPDDKELAKKFVPKKKYLAACVPFSDDRGKQVNQDRGQSLVQLTGGLYQEIIDLYLDEDEWGDMTDPEDGYDLKLTRSGKTMTDTEYSVKPCKNTPAPKGFTKGVDVEKMVKEIMPTYEETEQKIAEFLNEGDSDSEEEETPRRKKKTSTSSRTGARRKKKRRNADI